MSDKPFDEEAIFKVACQIQSPQARSAYLNQVCGDNLAALERISALLRAFDEESHFLCSPPPGIEPTELTALTEQPGDTIGPYKLLQQIGEGGMGVVYMAEQTHPVERRVALKIIKPGMDTRQGHRPL